jgi:hypothetical protein
MTTTSYPPPTPQDRRSQAIQDLRNQRPPNLPGTRAAPRVTNGDDRLIGLGIASFILGVILAAIGASQDPPSSLDEANRQAAYFGWGIALGSLSFFLILLGTIIRAGKIAAGRR